MFKKIFIILIIFCLAAYIDLPRIIKRKQWKEFTLAIVFFVLGLVINIAGQVFDFRFFEVSRWIVTVFGIKD